MLVEINMCLTPLSDNVFPIWVTIKVVCKFYFIMYFRLRVQDACLNKK